MIKLIEGLKKINLIERFNLDNKKITLILIISVMILYLDLNFLLKAQMSGIKKSAEGVIKLKNDFKALDLGLNNMQAAKGQQKNLSKGNVKKAISEFQLPSLLQDISKTANINNVRILQIKPTREVQKAGANGNKLSPVSISLDLVCGYHNLGKFINDLENNQTFIAVENFKIDASPDSSLKQKVNLTLKTYVRK